MSLYDDVMTEMKERDIYKHEVYAPYYISSFAIHHFNLNNQRRRIYWSGKAIPNNRLHILFVSPAGYMKSYYLRVMAGDEYSIFRGSGTRIGFEQELTSAGFTGSSIMHNGAKTRTIGAAEEYQDGLMLIEEFVGLTAALSGEGNGQMESQVLCALDNGKIVKRLSADRIEYTTNLTMWTGIQPAKLDISSGLGRRLCYMLFMPTRLDNEKLLDAMHHQRGMRPDVTTANQLWSRQKRFIKDLDLIETVTFSDDILEYYKRMRIFSYEANFFDNLILGLHLAKNGPEKHVTVDISDQDIKNVISQEKGWRAKINQGVDYIQMLSIITALGGEPTINEIYEEATMVGWNISQVSEIIVDMMRNGILMRQGNRVKKVVAK